MGLPISLIWVNPETEPNKNEKVELLRDLKHDSKRNRHYGNNFESSDVLEEKTDEINGFLVPGSCSDSWSDIESASFLLGLYIFEKNFVKVKKFMETKKMGEILLYYHAKFYKTAEYRRWSGCRKLGKTRRCVLGKNLFSGLRQQELLSRLVRGISDELQHALMQVSKSFSDRKTSLEDYIFSLKNMVGINDLVNAVGIGRGKQDLTGPWVKPTKANQAIHIRPEVPIGKACSSLSPSEIIEFLTGDSRLSKSRSADLFWEAVWPILVDKGWNATKSSSFNVFFAPGVPKSTSRRRLVKGEEYFDSIVDVLNLIASDPGIIGLDETKDDGTDKTEVEDENDDQTPERHRRCYLQPRTPSRCTDVMAFTVVDTSLSNGKTHELRNLRDLPVEVSRKLTLISQSGEDTPEASSDESDSGYTMHVEKDNRNVKKLTRSRSENETFVKRKDLEAQTSLNHDIGSKNANAGNAHMAPVGKRRRRVSSQDEMNLTRPSSDTPEITENNVHSSQVKLSATTSSSRASSMESFEEQAQVNEPNDRPLFDLNLPAEVLDFDCDDFLRDLAEPQNSPNEEVEPMAAGEEEQVNFNPRRQGSRNRPPTARALEAIVHGFMSVNSRRRRGRGESSRSRSRSSQEEDRGSGPQR